MLLILISVKRNIFIIHRPDNVFRFIERVIKYHKLPSDKPMIYSRCMDQANKNKFKQLLHRLSSVMVIIIPRFSILNIKMGQRLLDTTSDCKRPADTAKDQHLVTSYETFYCNM